MEDKIEEQTQIQVQRRKTIGGIGDITPQNSQNNLEVYYINEPEYIERYEEDTKKKR